MGALLDVGTLVGDEVVIGACVGAGDGVVGVAVGQESPEPEM